MAMENKRIIQLNTERTTPAADDYVMVDSATAGTAKYLLPKITDAIDQEISDRTSADTAINGEITQLKEDLIDVQNDLTQYEDIFTGDVDESVKNWLDEHPEATTTVQDGSLTEPKFSDALKLKAIKDYVTPEMFGAVGDGVTDDSVSFSIALNSGKNVYISSKTYYCNDLIGVDGIENVTIFGNGIIKTDKPVLFSFSNCKNLTIYGLNLKCEYDTNAYENVGEHTQDPNGYTDLSAMLDINSCNNILLHSISIEGGYTGIYAKLSLGISITHSEISLQRHICVCCSSSQFNVSKNKIHGITNPYENQYANYLFQATDSSPTSIQEHSIIDGNEFYDNYNWDAIMSHIYSELIITNNHIYNVRNGIDLTPLANTHNPSFEFKNIIIANNIIQGTDKDVETPYSHQNNGISFATATENVYNLVITGNIIRNFCKFIAPDYCTVHISRAHKAIISDNIIENADPLSATYGNCIEIRSKCDSIVIANNSFLCPSSIIALNNGSVEIDKFSIHGNVIDTNDAPITFLSLQADSIIKNLDFNNLVPAGINNVRCPAGCTINDITFDTTVDSYYYAQTQLQRLTYTYSTSIPAGGTVTFTVNVPYTIRNTDIFIATTSNRFVKASIAYGAWKVASITLENTDSAATSGTITINAVRLAL